jgi:signal transduction histidine kinase
MPNIWASLNVPFIHFLLQFFPNSNVEIQLATKDEQAIIHVCDRGIGISLAHQLRIFERFYRSDDPSTRSRDGTGLGLAIAKSLVEGMDGRITVLSKPNEGSIFTITLPIWNPQR